jgi:hypothetical protein
MKNLFNSVKRPVIVFLKVGLLAVFAGGSVVHGVQRVDGALLFVHLSTKTWQKWN